MGTQDCVKRHRAEHREKSDPLYGGVGDSNEHEILAPDHRTQSRQSHAGLVHARVDFLFGGSALELRLGIPPHILDIGLNRGAVGTGRESRYAGLTHRL